MDNVNFVSDRNFNTGMVNKDSLNTKNNGIIRKIDALGRLVIPMEMRKVLQMNVGDDIEIHNVINGVMLVKHSSKCIYCGNENELVAFKGTSICRRCINEVSKKMSADKPE